MEAFQLPRRALTEAARCFVQAAQRPNSVLGEGEVEPERSAMGLGHAVCLLISTRPGRVGRMCLGTFAEPCPPFPISNPCPGPGASPPSSPHRCASALWASPAGPHRPGVPGERWAAAGAEEQRGIPLPPAAVKRAGAAAQNRIGAFRRAEPNGYPSHSTTPDTVTVSSTRQHAFVPPT